MDVHICPHCSQPCAFKHGIMCTINGCVKDSNTNQNGNGWDSLYNLMSMFGTNQQNQGSNKK